MIECKNTQIQNRAEKDIKKEQRSIGKNRNLLYLKPTISIITLNINCQTLKIKGQGWQTR